MRERLRRFALTRTRLGSPGVRRLVRAGKRARRRGFERLGSDRYSHPALDDLDRKLAAFMPERGGVFIEAGAWDGYWQSNTYWFERFRDWSGVLVEPVPHLAAQARRERPGSKVFTCALVAPRLRDEQMRMRVGGTMSVLLTGDEDAQEAIEHAEIGAAIARERSYEIEVPASTLSDILDRAGVGEVDLFSLDVEGHELEVLKGLDLERHAPRYLLIELTETHERPAIESLIGSRYDFVEQLSPRDHLFRRRPPV